MVESLRMELKKAQFTTEVVMDGAYAVEKTQTFLPDLVLMDLLLPNKDGFQILYELKEHPQLKKIPVIILSNLGHDEDIKRGLKLGAADYIVKAQQPISEVIKKIRQCL